MNKRYWWILIVYILMQVSGLAGAPLLMAFGLNLQESTVLWSLVSFAAALIVMLFLVLPERRSDRHPHLRKTSRGHAVKWAVLGIFLVFLAQYIAILIEMAIGIEPGSQNTQDILSIVEMFPVFAVIVAVIGPILEEIVFRKVLFGTFYRHFNFVISALLSALIFSLVHFDFTHVLIYTAVGFAFSYLYVKTGRILVPIVAHVAMNSYAILVQVMFGDQIQEMQRKLEQVSMILGGIML
ncbi:CPBP family glutamic-type intramembrane protease [Salibacterium sp. K-3]